MSQYEGGTACRCVRYARDAARLRGDERERKGGRCRPYEPIARAPVGGSDEFGGNVGGRTASPLEAKHAAVRRPRHSGLLVHGLGGLGVLGLYD